MKHQEVVLSDGKRYSLLTSFVPVKDVLGSVRATLIEYTLTEKSSTAPIMVYKLHKTKDGCWYNHPFEEKPTPFLMMKFRAAIDKAEK
jgi:hypothetical protein